MQDDLAVPVRQPAVHGIAAHHRDHVGILLGLIFPQDLAVVVEIERIDQVGEGRVDVHRAADNQRSAFMTAENAGRKRPGHLERLDVLGVDRVEPTVPRRCIVLVLHRPLLVFVARGRRH